MGIRWTTTSQGAMTEHDGEDRQIALAVSGDAQALEGLLLARNDWLVAWIARQLPAGLQGSIAPEDVAQETYVQAFRDIKQFHRRDEQSFTNWLMTIAKHRLLDFQKREKRKKRGGGWAAVQAGRDASIASL